MPHLELFILLAKHTTALLAFTYVVFCTLGDPTLKILFIGCVSLVHYSGSEKITSLDKELRFATGVSNPFIFLLGADLLGGLTNATVFLSLPACLIFGFLYAGLLMITAKDFEILSEANMERFDSSVIRYVFLSWLTTTFFFYTFAKAIYE